MRYERLLAKSERKGDNPSPAQTLRKHTSEVMKTAARLVEVTGRAQLEALGLDPGEWFGRFRREVRLAALLHDLGKANSHFQEMVHDPGRLRIQGLRHEAVSFLIARELSDWVRAALTRPHSAELVLWAVAGHHRKFPPAAAPDGAGASMWVYFEHPDFRKVLELGQRDTELNLGPPPVFDPDHRLARLRLTNLDGIFAEYFDAGELASATWAALNGQEKRYLAALKACLICADVAGSIGRRGDEPMADWITRAFARAPTAEQLETIVRQKLDGAKLRDFQRVLGQYCTFPEVG